MLKGKKFEIDIIDHIKDIMSFIEVESGEDILEERSSPASNFIFKVNESAE